MHTETTTEMTDTVMSPQQFFAHWQGHRRLTRKLIEAYPDDQLFTYSIGGMRPFAHILLEILDLAGGGIQGIVTGQWQTMNELSHVSGDMPQTKAEMLHRWDAVTKEIDELAPQICPARFQETVAAFGMYEDTVYATLLYFIDNEIHHRAQAYVYLRSLNVTPPPFWDRA